MTRPARTPLPAEFGGAPSPSAPEADAPYTTPGASNKQLNFITGLLAEREVKPETADALGPRLAGQIVANEEHGDNAPAREGLSKRRASEVIGKLLDLPKRAQELPARGGPVRDIVAESRPALPEVPAGRYAVEEDGTLKFFRVDRPTEGRWAGRTFLKIQASDDLHPVRDRARVAKILGLIAEDPRAASVRYGRELGACGICGRTLTDEDSRAAGIGPVCAGKAGW